MEARAALLLLPGAEEARLINMYASLSVEFVLE